MNHLSWGLDIFLFFFHLFLHEYEKVIMQMAGLKLFSDVSDVFSSSYPHTEKDDYDDDDEIFLTETSAALSPQPLVLPQGYINLPQDNPTNR